MLLLFYFFSFLLFVFTGSCLASFAPTAVVAWLQRQQQRRRPWPSGDGGVMATAVAVCCVVCWDTSSYRLTQLSTSFQHLQTLVLSLCQFAGWAHCVTETVVVWISRRFFKIILVSSRFVCRNPPPPPLPTPHNYPVPLAVWSEWNLIIIVNVQWLKYALSVCSSLERWDTRRGKIRCFFFLIVCVCVCVSVCEQLSI